MNELNARVVAAFNAVEVPSEVKARTLDALKKQNPPHTLQYVSPEQSYAHSQQNTNIPYKDALPNVRVVRSRAHRPQKIMAIAACFILTLVLFAGAKLYFEETAYVGIEVNPSLELALNRFDIVVGVRALNSDGESLARSVSLAGKQYDQAIVQLMSSESFAPYLSNNPYLSISVTAQDEARAEVLQEQSNRCLQMLCCDGEARLAPNEARRSAQEVGMGVGRYRASLELIALDSRVTLQECSSLSMRTLQDRIQSANARAEASQ